MVPTLRTGVAHLSYILLASFKTGLHDNSARKAVPLQSCPWKERVLVVAGMCMYLYVGQYGCMYLHGYSRGMPEAVNFFPTISSAIGLEPQKYVWRLSIALHIGLRFVLAAGYFHWHLREDLLSQTRRYRQIVTLTVACHVIENLALLTLTTISSTDNGDIHEYSFVSFIVFSQIYMIMSCCLIYWTHRKSWIKVTEKDTRTLRRKVALWLFNLFIFLLSIYLYFRHNSYCEPYVYSYFAICEYLTVFSNIAFHYQAIHDFGDYSLALLASDDVVSSSKNS